MFRYIHPLLNFIRNLFLKLGSTSDDSRWVNLQVKPSLFQSHGEQNTKQKTFRPQIHQDFQDNKKMRKKLTYKTEEHGICGREGLTTWQQHLLLMDKG